MEQNQKYNPAEGGTSPIVSHRFTMRQVENALYEHSGVDEVAVFFVTGDDGVEKLVAFVVPRAPGLTEAEIMDFLAQSGQLGTESLPHAVKLVPRIPKSPSGKVLKLRLLEGICP
ncbi:acyl--CoA ligase [Desulfallas sp. Bu1-1]|jgi:acyl-CoA synthetase (AMP-forming)/AMP-acid ligase II|uniref:AMP-binding enzyme n=1 Tax=Desulfallas sp. Bu1-1 TaxID=2787620 RepID=UPI00189FA645|nr:class I adenylate-forming enzyme family protein [Desulfallas sp. Bu1-1]MBF7082238.1 acyl--CoA ligase [Desulfallas sp. Bu1-1]